LSAFNPGAYSASITTDLSAPLSSLPPNRAMADDRQAELRFQNDWAGRVLNNGKVTGLFADYHYYGTGDIGGAPDEESVKRLEAIITKGTVGLPPQNGFFMLGQDHPAWPATQVGEGPVHVISA